jgi:hypothetical protein
VQSTHVLERFTVSKALSVASLRRNSAELGFTFFARLSHNTPPAAFMLRSRILLKLRAWLFLLLFVHVVLHPWVHTMGTAKPASASVVVSSNLTPSESSPIGDQCELCRVGHNATVTPQLPKTAVLNPRWIRTTLQAVNYASLQSDRRLPSRAPPTL